jgi:hypothetical protein
MVSVSCELHMGIAVLSFHGNSRMMHKDFRTHEPFFVS